MSTRVIDGAYVNLVAKVPTNASAKFGAIGVVGHMMSGIKTSPDGTVTVYSGATSGADWDTFDASSVGLVYEFNSFDEVVNKFGSIPEASWNSGTFVEDGTDTSGYDPKYNLLRSLELIYLANPTVKTFVTVIDGSGTSASAGSSSAGVSSALGELLKQDEISFVVGAGMDFNSTFQSHATSASSVTNQAERIYVGGTALQEVMASGSRTPDLDASSDNDNDWSALLDDSGRSIFTVENILYKFQSDHPDAPANGYEVGGNFYASYLAGYLSSLPESRSLLRLGTGFAQKYNSNNFRWSKSDQTTLVNGSVVHFKTSGGRTTFSRALTYSSSSSAFRRITTRRITDRVIKELRATSETFVGRENTEITRIGMKSSLDTKLDALTRFGLIQPGSYSTVWVEGTDVADGVVRVSSLVKPVTEIEFVEIQLTVEL